jgi:hypothetical protein
MIDKYIFDLHDRLGSLTLIMVSNDICQLVVKESHCALFSRLSL